MVVMSIVAAGCLTISTYCLPIKEWQGIKQFGVIQADRTSKGKVTTALRLYISSNSMTTQQMLSATRTHWQVGNNLHWMLDVSFNEDACQTKHENGAENLSTLRRIGLNIFKMDKARSGSVNVKKQAGIIPIWLNYWISSYLTHLWMNNLLDKSSNGQSLTIQSAVMRIILVMRKPWLA